MRVKAIFIAVASVLILISFLNALCQGAQPSPKEVMAEFELALQKAMAAAKSTEESYSRSVLLRCIAEATSEAGLFDQALQIIRDIPLGTEAADAIRYGANMAASAKESKILEQLIDVAKGIRDRFYRERALSYIAASMADVGLFEQAIKIATSIKESYIRSSAFSSISVAMAKFGHKEAELFVKKALEAAKKVRGEIIVDGAVFIDRHSMALMDFSEDASKGGFFNYALEAVKEIESEEFKSWGIYYIAVWAARSGKQEYKPLLYQLLEMSQAIQEARYSVLALSAIAAAFQKIGEQNEANSLFERAIKLANEVTDKFDRSRTWRNIARAMAFAGMYDKAIDFAKQAEFFSSAAFRIICSEMVRDGLLEQAYQIAKDISNIEERSAALHNVAIAMIKAGKIEKAAGIAREMSKTLRKHPKSIRLAVMIMAEAGNWGEALELTKDIQDVQEYLRALAHIVKAMKTAKMFKGS